MFILVSWTYAKSDVLAKLKNNVWYDFRSRNSLDFKNPGMNLDTGRSSNPHKCFYISE